MTYDAAERKVITSGGFFSGGFTDESWLWDGTTWEQVDQTPIRPRPRSGHAFTHDVARRANVLFGGTSFFTDTWLLYRLGASCTTNAQCPGAFCTDGVCCNAPSCGTCQTCAGQRRGECSFVNNAEDADSCPAAQGRACDAVGDCKLANGQMATSATECASGIVADGVCCNVACEGTCQACRRDLKESGTLSGICDNAKSGTDAHADCEATDVAACGFDGTCDGRGACRLYPAGSSCGDSACVDNRATGRVCDGLGACTETAAGIACGFFACVDGNGCKTGCETDAECNARSHCEGGACVPNEGASCDGDHVVVSPDGARFDCAPFKCEGSVCRPRCQSVADCVFPAQCTNEGRCVAFDAAESEPPKEGCHASPVGEANAGAGVLAALGIGLARGRVRKRRSAAQWASRAR